MSDYESGKAAIITLNEQFGSDNAHALNEAETRFQILDRILSEALCWPRSSIHVEKHMDGQYSDYELGNPVVLLIEAKRESVRFELPIGWNKPTAKIETLYELSDEIGSAISQALEYCQPRGIPYGAISNGHQIVAFIASRQDGIAPRKGKALVFASLKEMESRFQELWEALSPVGLGDSALERILGVQVLPLPPSKLSKSTFKYPGYKNRNATATELQILGGLFIEDLARSPEIEEEFLTETYCTSGALSQYSLVSKELLKARYATYFEKDGEISAAPATNKKGTAPELTQDIFAASLSKRPILLVGDVGSGKSIFIQNLIKVEAKDEFKRSIVLYIDFGTKPAVANDLRTYVISEIILQLEAKYGIDVYERNFVRGVYDGRIRRFSKGIYSDLRAIDPSSYVRKEIEYIEDLTKNPEEHLKECLLHASKGQKRQVVVFLDNVDQRPTAFQEEVFLIGQAFSANWPVTCFVSLRPETFALSKVRGALAAYQPRVFTIEPPRVDLVLKKRLQFAKNQLEKHGRLPWLPEGFSIQSETLLDYLNMLLWAFEYQHEIIEFVDNMCAGNIRKALDFISSFVGSGHVDSGKILDIIYDQGSYSLPLHEFLRAIMHGDNEHYDPLKSPIINLFDVSTTDEREYFLVLLLISFIEKQGQIGGSEGYAEKETVYRFAQELGFHPTQIRIALRRCLEKNLIGSPLGGLGDDVSRYRVTTIGAYCVKRLAFLFTYIDAILIDTPLLDAPVRKQILNEHHIEGRLDRAMIFVNYLDTIWSQLPTEFQQHFDWAHGTTKIRTEITRIKDKLHNAHGR